jgi:hypothetical protein
MKKKKPTPAQVKAEIKKLEKMKPTVRSTSHFGDNHHDAIDAQLAVMKEGLDNDAIYDRYEHDPQNVLDAALEVMGWMDGGSCGDGEPPTKNWESLVRKS